MSHPREDATSGRAEAGNRGRSGGGPGGGGWLAAAGLASLLTVACEGLLDVPDPGIVTPEENAGPAAVESKTVGVVGTGIEAVDDYALYAGLFTDEMISSGTFPTRREVDERDILTSNITVNQEVYEPLHTVRSLADRRAEEFREALDDPAFSEVPGDLREGIAISTWWSGYSRVLLSELYCESTLDAGAPLGSDARMEEALELFRQAESAAGDAGLEAYVHAALVGQARALLWLRRFAEADAAAAAVPRDFRLEAEHSGNDPTQGNEVFQVTWGSATAGTNIRWTVGAGDEPDRQFEAFAEFDRFVELGIVDPASPLRGQAQNDQIEVNLQLIYDEEASPVVIASGVEARLIRAEVAVRESRAGDAEGLINDLRSDWPTRFTLERRPVPGASLDPISLSGELQDDLRRIASERARELWLTGDRQGVSRRLLVDGVDLYPAKPGTQTCWPFPDQEIDNNPNL